MASPVAKLSAAGVVQRPFMVCSSGSRSIRSTCSAMARAAAGRPTLRTTPNQRQQLSQPTLLCRADGGERQSQQQPGEPAEAAASSSPPTSAPKRPRVEDPSVAKGQRTAIITGTISIIFGIVYLGLVSFLDMRGGEMLPPPPEAFENM